MHTTTSTPGTLSAVRTTGIYCRPGCSARPDPRNVSAFDASVSAEAAGYRACLQCRPDREAEWIPPETMPAPLRRAVAKIAEGALDDATEEQLAADIGFSPRHLRRLFLEHIGATPAFVARSRRAHFARALLDDTDLAVTEIAFASGFSSVRQMNRVVKEVFAFTPTELRAKRRNVLDAADGGLALRLRLPQPMDAPAIIEHLAPRATPGVESVVDGVYCRTLELCGHPGAIEIAPVGVDELRITAHLPTFSGLVDVMARVRRLFGADTDHAAAIATLSSDALMAPLVAAEPGLRIAGCWDGFESAVRIVIGQQVTVAGASTLTGRVAAAAGRHVPGLERLGLDRLFPGPEELLEADLRDLGFTERRLGTLLALADAVVTGDVDLQASADDLRASLVALPGVGPWTAELIAMRVSRDRDAFPSSDLGIRKGAAALVGDDALSAREIEALAERWQPHRALAATHLWRAA